MSALWEQYEWRAERNGVMYKENDTVYHERANHEDNLHVSRTNAFISLNGFVAVAVGLTNEKTWLRLVFSLMVFLIDLFWALWANQASIFIRALRDAGENRADEQLWQWVSRSRFPRVASLNPLTIMNRYIPWFFTLTWLVIFSTSFYKLFFDIKYPLLAILVVSVLLIWGAIKFTDHRRFVRNEEKAHKILAGGGPRSRTEYEFLFPDACRYCGCREIEVTEWTEGYPEGGDDSRTYMQCSKCRNYLGRTHPAYYPTEKKYNRTISSPYLTQEQADKVPVFPYTSTSTTG